MNSYDLVPYPGVPIPRSHARRLEAVAALFGLSPAPPASARVLELGCGCGANLLPQALEYPAASFVGCDAAGSAIASARTLAQALGLENVDPSAGGCQSYEASNFLLNAYSIDPSSQLILWQIGTLGDWTYKRQGCGTKAVPLLVQRLAEFYPLSHTVTVYEAATLPGTEPMIVQIQLDSLSEFPITTGMTLYVPPARTRTPDPEIQRLFNLANG